MTTIDHLLAQIQTIDVNTITGDESVKPTLVLLLNAIEALAQQNRHLRDTNAYLNRLLGQPPDPDADDEASPPPGNQDKKAPGTPRRKPLESSSPTAADSPAGTAVPRPELKITRTEPRFVERSTLPPDAVHKGDREVIIQELSLLRYRF